MTASARPEFVTTCDSFKIRIVSHSIIALFSPKLDFDQQFSRKDCTETESPKISQAVLQNTRYLQIFQTVKINYKPWAGIVDGLPELKKSIISS
jgi:hypothetical protein